MPDFNIIVPKMAVIRAKRGRMTGWAREKAYWLANRKGQTENDLRRQLGLEPVKRGDRIVPKMVGAAGSFTDFAECALLDAVFHDGTFATYAADPYIGLWTGALTDASTGATANECSSAANTYNGYNRALCGAAAMNAAASGTPSSKANGSAITFPACAANNATVTYWGTCDNNTPANGNMYIWGTCTSTTIDTSHTPPTIAQNALSVTLD